MDNELNKKNRHHQGLEAYVNYLLEDLANAKRSKEERKKKLFRRDTFSDLWAEKDDMNLKPVHAFGELCGLREEQFPPAALLSNVQLKKMIKAFHELLSSWSFSASIPSRVPLQKQYALLVSVLKEKVLPLETGTAYFDFCTDEPSSCPFENNCQCMKLPGGMGSKKEPRWPF